MRDLRSGGFKCSQGNEDIIVKTGSLVGQYKDFLSEKKTLSFTCFIAFVSYLSGTYI